MPSRHKNRIRKSGKNYTERQEEGMFDELSGENLSDIQTPWSSTPVTDAEYDKIDALYDLYDNLKGRQKQVLRLLLQGETNHDAIAKSLKMKRPNVTICIQEIRKKVLKDHTK